MRTYLMSLSFYIWISEVDGYKVLETPPSNKDGTNAFVNNVKAKNAILCGLLES